MSATYEVKLTKDERKFLLKAIRMVKHETEHPTVEATLRAARATPAECGDCDGYGWVEYVYDDPFEGPGQTVREACPTCHQSTAPDHTIGSEG